MMMLLWFLAMMLNERRIVKTADPTQIITISYHTHTYTYHPKATTRALSFSTHNRPCMCNVCGVG